MYTMPSTSKVLSTYTAFAASAILVRTMVTEVQTITSQIIPKKLKDLIMSKLQSLSNSSEMTLTIDECFDGMTQNHVYKACHTYLSTIITPSNKRLKVTKAQRDTELSVSINKGEEIVDFFEGVMLKWVVLCEESQKAAFDDMGGITNEKVERKSIELRFCNEHKEMVLKSYLPFVLNKAKTIQEKNRVVKLYTLGHFCGDYDGMWGSINLEHPSTFDTLAMDPVAKRALIDDLDRFVNRKVFYQRVGKAWKRGYLLYGPPGTGKSSLIAAMANYLKFHVYDLELSNLHSDSELRRLLVSTTNRSILVIEDIDCSIPVKSRDIQPFGDNGDNQKLTLSGLLNFCDGLWSSCGDEKIIVFTTNYKEKLDPALLRSGRMDMHIHMTYLTPSGFEILASNYLNIKSHTLFPEIKELITQVELTPAAAAEELMKGDDVGEVLADFMLFLQNKKDALMNDKPVSAEELAEPILQASVESSKKKVTRKKSRSSKRNMFP